MNARILELDSAEHRYAQTLLPWHANGTLGGAERERVEAHVAQCPRCQGDLALQARICAQAPAAALADELERGWAALRHRLDDEARPQRPAAMRAPDATPVPAARWRWPRGPRRSWAALALNGVAVLGLAVALAAAWHPPPPYRALGAAPAAPVADALVVFRADATEAQIRAALRAADARLVGGPTVTDAYLLRLNAPGAQTLARLRAQAAVLRVESLDAEGAR